MESIIFIIKSNTMNREAASLAYLPPLGVMSISTVLEMHGYNVEVLDLSVESISGVDIVERIRAINPIYVGVSCYTENIDDSLKLCKYIKQKTNTRIIIGGPHPTLCPDYCYKSRFIDFICIGEGEATCLELAEAFRSEEKLIKISEIDGLIYRAKSKKFTKSEKRANIANLDVLPIIKRQYIGRSLNSKYVAISSSRGCPAKCIYCAAPKMFGGRYRVREIENVYMETVHLLTLTDFKNEIYYIDDTFTAIIKRVYKYIDLVKNYGLKFKWRCESRVDVLSKNLEIVKEMQSIGCQRMQYGIESGNQDVLNKINKNMDLQKAKDLIDYSISIGLRIATSFIFGHYCDTEETMDDTLNMMLDLNEKHGDQIELLFSYNTPFPGTYQYDNSDELGINLKVAGYNELDMLHPVVETENFTIDTLYSYGRKVMRFING